MKIMALILARGGSKRIPRKNIKTLGGKPLIAYTIEGAKQSRYVNRIIVSTDDPEIAAVSEQYGAEAPFLRPKEISQEASTELDAFRHALSFLKNEEGYVPDLIVKLFATAPFRKTESIDKAIDLLLANPEADGVRSVKLCSEHPYKMWILGADGYLQSFIPLKQKPKEAHTLSYQILPTIYIQNANIDVTRPANIWKKNSIIGSRILAYVMDEFESVDINTPIDFSLAETLIETQKNGDNVSMVIIDEDLEAYTPYLGVDLDCIVCNSRENMEWAQYASYKAVKCASCGLVWIKPFLNDTGRQEYYRDYIGMRFRDKVKTEQRQIQYQIDKKFIESFLDKGRVLDIGCSGGFFLGVLSSTFEKHGVEIDAAAVDYARTTYDFGENIVCEDLFNTFYEQESFDLVILRGVIEHMPNPHQVIEKVGALTKPGGFCYISATPNVDAFCADLYREKWNQFHPIRHLFYFNVDTLSQLFRKVGMECIAKDFPYMGTPYANIETDHLEVMRTMELKQQNRFDEVKRSPAFWGNMMNLVFKKAEGN